MHTCQPDLGFVTSGILALGALAQANLRRARRGTGASNPEGSSMVRFPDAIGRAMATLWPVIGGGSGERIHPQPGDGAVAGWAPGAVSDPDSLDTRSIRIGNRLVERHGR